MVQLPFPSRREAGVELSKALEEYRGAKDTLVFALVRGGVVVGRAIADALSLPLFPYIVRKLGHPHHREFALGAISEGGGTYLDEPAMQVHGVSWKEMEPIIEEEMSELRRRKDVYAVKKRPPLAGMTVILTDDGAATGATILAAMEDFRKIKVKKIVVALPVCPPDTMAILKKKTDKAIALATPEPFEAVGLWYKDFQQVEDEEVIRLLQ